ncbi:MAG: hypothetical protein R3F31_08205 [Verrucomicrobiales bacterium]
MRAGSPFLGVPAVVFRDRVIQGARSFDNPWQAMVILDSAELARTGGELTFFLGVGEEDPGPDGTMDISPDRSRKGLIFQYQLKGSSITLPGTGQTFPRERARPSRSAATIGKASKSPLRFSR